MDSIEADRAWAEYQAMSDRDRGYVLAYLAGQNPEGFVRAMQGYRRSRLRATVAAACRREQDAEAES